MNCKYCGDPNAHPGTRKCSDDTECILRLERQERKADMAAEYERGIAEGERRERSAVVAWLRTRAAGPVEPEEYTLLAALADRCEAGEHKETT